MRADRHDLPKGCGRPAFDARNLFPVTYACADHGVFRFGIVFDAVYLFSFSKHISLSSGNEETVSPL